MTTQPKPRLTSRSLPVVSLDEELPAARRARLASGEVVEQHPSPTPGPVGDDFADAFMQEWLSDRRSARQTRSQPSLAPTTALPTSRASALPTSPHSAPDTLGGEDTTDPLAAILETGDTHLVSEVSRIEGSTVFAISEDEDLWGEVQQTAQEDLAHVAQVEEQKFQERFEQRLEVVANPVSIEQVKAREKVAKGERWFGVGLGIIIVAFIIGVVVLVWLWSAQPQTIPVEPTTNEPVVVVGTDPDLIKWRG